MKMFLVLAGLVLAVSLAHGEDDTNGNSHALPAGSFTGPPTPACPAPLCGKQGGGLECPDNKCCSQDGKCGYGYDYCSGECQSGPCYLRFGVEQRCGRNFGDRKCTNNYCCSADGYCGFGMAYCNPGEYPTAETKWPVPRRYAGCQSGPCRNTPCSETKRCSNNQCCSPKGICGIGHLYCGDGCKGGPCYHGRGTLAGNATAATAKMQAQVQGGALALTGPPSPPSPSPPSKCQNRCGAANGGLLCPDNQCCSKDGKCGLGAEYCDLGCQSGQCYPNNYYGPGAIGARCGPKGGKRRCTNNYCCSRDGYCGVGPEYCEGYCQSQYGICYRSYYAGQEYFDMPWGSLDNLCTIKGWKGRRFTSGLGPWYCGDGCIGHMCYVPTPWKTHVALTAAANATTLPPALQQS